MAFIAVLAFLLMGIGIIIDEIFSAVAAVFPYMILLAIGIGAIAALGSVTRSRFLKMIIAINVILLLYATGTPGGAVRTAVLFSGHPVKAVSLHVRKAYEAELELENWKECEKKTLYHVTQNAPLSKNGEHSLDMWSVTRRGWLFYSAQHYGETDAYLARKALGKFQCAQDTRPVTVYRAYEDFTVHGFYVPRDTVVVLETLEEGRTGIVVYGKNADGKPERWEDVLLNSELPESTPRVIYGPWCYYLPLDTPQFRSEKNSGVSITPQLFAALDPSWSSDRHLSYQKSQRLSGKSTRSFEQNKKLPYERRKNMNYNEQDFKHVRDSLALLSEEEREALYGACAYGTGYSSRKAKRDFTLDSVQRAVRNPPEASESPMHAAFIHLYENSRRRLGLSAAELIIRSYYKICMRRPEDRQELAIASRVLGEMLLYQSDPIPEVMREVEQLLVQSLTTYQSPDVDEEAKKAGRARTLSSLGIVRMMQNQYAQAEAYLSEASTLFLELLKERGEEWTPHYAGSLINLGDLYSETGEISKAVHCFRHAIEMLEKCTSYDSHYILLAMDHVAEKLAMLND